MALAPTSLTSDVAVNDNSIRIASATGVTVGMQGKIDQEIVRVAASYISGGLAVAVLRGQDGTATATHKSGAKVVFELASDLAGPAPQTVVQFHTQRAVIMISLSATGAIPLQTPGSDARIALNGTTIIAATLAAPTKDMDGDKYLIFSNGAAAHTVTYAGGLGAVGGTADVLTFTTGQYQAYEVVAANGAWVGIGAVAGAATLAGAGLA